jgi:thiol-disulfide isomerase/thioredoxin
MKTNNQWDTLCGLISAILALVSLSIFEFKIAFLFITLIAFIAGVIRGQDLENIFKKVFLLNILHFIFLIHTILGLYHFAFILLFSLIASFLGIITKRWKLSSKMIFGMLVTFLMLVPFFALFVIPAYFDSRAWRTDIFQVADYKLLTLTGDTIRSSQFKNKIIVMDFWASWCGPCKRQLPILEKVYKKYKANTAVVFFVINVNDMKESNEKMMKFIKNHPYDLPFVVDIEKKATDALFVYSLPTLVIIDKNGCARFVHKSYNESENFLTICSDQIDLLIREK